MQGKNRKDIPHFIKLGIVAFTVFISYSYNPSPIITNKKEKKMQTNSVKLSITEEMRSLRLFLWNKKILEGKF